LVAVLACLTCTRCRFFGPTRDAHGACHGEGNVHVREMPNDCVHFALPGVPDWWSHQLQTQLNELSNCALSAWRTGEG